jgi:hypothetical protein
MSDGYKTTVNLIPYMSSLPADAGDRDPREEIPPLIVVGVKPSQGYRRIGDTMMLFPKYLLTRTQPDATTRTIDQALDLLKVTFKRDDHRRGDVERPRLEGVFTLVLCVESLPEAGVNVSFTRSIAKYCGSVDELVVYYSEFEGLVSSSFFLFPSKRILAAHVVVLAQRQFCGISEAI